MKKRLFCILLSLLICLASAMSVPGASGSGQGTRYGSGPDDRTYYIFDGKKYVIDYSWGQHYLTGFSAAETGNAKTTSGAIARENYTAASTRANLGKVILVKAVSGGADKSRYDGVYKCEDTGGPAVETGVPNTGGVPVVDLYFNDLGSAQAVTDQGWITAEIFILKEAD